MVSATVAEANQRGVTIKRTDGMTVKVSRANIADDTRAHGINLDEADELVENLGWVAGKWRWQREGFYKAVVTPI